MKNEKMVILTSLVGSRGFGTHTESSDEDYINVFLDKPNYYLGLNSTSNEQHISENSDICNYEFRYFVKMCMNANPNVIVALFSKNLTFQVPFGCNLFKMRHEFISQRIFTTFTGYATSQFKRMTGELSGKMGSKRKVLVDKFGYDTKYAYHTIRLLRMATECLNDGTLNVKRTHDVDFLKSIRNGTFNLEEIKEIIKNEYLLCEQAKEKTKIAKEPDFDKINNMVFDTLYSYIKMIKR